MSTRDDLKYYVGLINKYPEISPTILDGYKPFEKEVVLNVNDQELAPIFVDILDLWQRGHREFGFEPPPDFPSENQVFGFGLPIEEQKFKREVYPKGLHDLEFSTKEKIRRMTKLTPIKREILFLNTMWETLSKQQGRYEEEIKWLEEMWYYRLCGKWFYIHGVPQWVPGWDWWFLNCWHVDDGRPEYRDRDRRWFIAQQFCWQDTTTFKEYDKNGRAVKNSEGRYDKIELGRKICFGSTNTKSRRVGDTTKAQSTDGEISTREVESNFGIQGKDSTNAEDVFQKHYIRNIIRIPWFFRPLATALDPKGMMEFKSEDPDFSLMNIIDFATTADRTAYDGKRLRFYHRDEPGKVKKEDINQAHQVIKQCLSLGMGVDIVGFMMYTTTVEEMNQRGGENYAKLCRDSHYDQRNKIGQTASGLYNIFFKGCDGMTGFVGPYGESIITDPTPEQKVFIKKEMGALDWIQEQRSLAIQKGDQEMLAELKRMFPLNFREAFTPPPANEYFDTIILEQNIQDLLLHDDLVLYGKFDWLKERFGPVVWINENPDTARGRLSKRLLEGESNQWIIIDGMKYPRFPDRFVACADAFRTEKTEDGRMSLGGGCVRWLFDPRVDGLDKPSEEWESGRTVYDYLFRPPTIIEYQEDMLMMSIYFGSMMYPENNITHVADFFNENGFGGYLLYDTDPANGDVKNNPGFTTVGGVKQKIFNLVQNDIKRNFKRNRHLRVAQQCMKIADPDDMTHFDLFTAYGGTLLAEESKLGTVLRDGIESSEDTSDWFDTFGF